ncbi:MAG TPA: hypothetical protein PLN91_00980 [Rhodanobacteraceae bacterium]|nr:hypothetical protein [Rhodanobacteraceae bacterium]
MALPGILAMRDDPRRDRRDAAYSTLTTVAREADEGRIHAVARRQLAAVLRDLLAAQHAGDPDRLAMLVEEAEQLLALEGTEWNGRREDEAGR